VAKPKTLKAWNPKADPTSGSNYEGTARQLNVEGIKTRSGGKWFAATVRKIILAQ
jgi:hypothetical protein